MLGYRHAYISSDQGAQIFQKSRNHLMNSSSSSPNIVLLSTMFPFLWCAPGLPQDGGNWFLQNAVPVQPINRMALHPRNKLRILFHENLKYFRFSHKVFTFSVQINSW